MVLLLICPENIDVRQLSYYGLVAESGKMNLIVI
jgi:hypothetical protein